MKVMNKKGFLLRDFVVVGIIFGVIIAMYIYSVASTANNYTSVEPGVMDRLVSPSFANNYNKLQTNLDRLNSATSSVQGTGGLNLIGSFNVAFNSVFTVVVMVWDGILVYTGMSKSMANDFNFLDKNVLLTFLGGIIAAISAYLIFVWLSSVSRGKI